MEEWGEQMEKWGEEYGEQMEQWGEQQGAQALAWSEQAQRNAPEVVHSCDDGEMAPHHDRRRPPADRDLPRRAGAQRGPGRGAGQAHALASLRRRRSAIARNQRDERRGPPGSARGLDDEIRRMERGED